MLEIRPARVPEVDLLSELALRSKGHWGYSQEFLEACRAELTVTTERLETESVLVSEDDGVVVGCASVAVDEDEVELVDLFVDPDHIGTGTGKALWESAIENARALGASRLRIEADPHAEAWYRSRGAIRVGEAASGSSPGRMLPLLHYPIHS